MSQFNDSGKNLACFLGTEKIPPVLASVAEAGTLFMVLTMTWSGPFGAGLGGSVVGLLASVNSVSQRLRALGSTR